MKKHISRLFFGALICTMAMGSVVACGKGNDENKAKESKYNAACSLLESRDYEGAYAAFKDLGEYKDAQAHLSRFIYFPSVVNYNLYDRSGVMTITLGSYNLPVHMFSEGIIEGQGSYTKDGWYTYDGKGNLMRQAVLYNSDFFAYDYTYDANNNIIKAENSEQGVVTAVHGYGYDEQGMLIRESYVADGVVYYDYVHTYDANGNLIKSVFESAEGDHTYIYVYNADGNMVNHTGATPDGYFYNNDYTYDSDGKMTKRVCTENGQPSYTIEFTYDNAGKCIQEEITYPDETKDFYTKEYDVNGNVKKVAYTYADGTVESVEYQYVFTYVTVDVPTWTMNQIEGLFDII